MKTYLSVTTFLAGAVLAFYSYGNWRTEELYNKIVSEMRMPPDEVLKALPEKARFIKAYLKELAGDLDGAAKDYEFVISDTEGRDSLALYNIANVLVKSAIEMKDAKMVEAAIDYYRAALRANPDFLEAQYNLDIAMRLIKNAKAENKKNESEPGQNNDAGIGTHVPFKAKDI